VKLFLASHRISDRFGELVAAAGPNARTAVIRNAIDFIPLRDREDYDQGVYDVLADFRGRGLDAFELDLKAFFGRPEALEAEMAGVRLVWATGGNAFLLRRAMRQSGFDELVRRRVGEGSLIYAGWSAGAVVAGPSLKGLELMDEPDLLAEGYDPEPIWQGLGLVDFRIVPHFRSDHVDGRSAEWVVKGLKEEGAAFRALRDGEAIVI
jgi:dipeptidase E